MSFTFVDDCVCFYTTQARRHARTYEKRDEDIGRESDENLCDDDIQWPVPLCSALLVQRVVARDRVDDNVIIKKKRVVKGGREGQSNNINC